tara:strand:- start:15 stop:452 length:438 start_codon:yes stop_codon:yes gene_type:complete
MRIGIFLFTLLTAISLAQTNAKALKVVKHKSAWKVYKSGMEIPKSHFFKIVNDEYNRDQSILYEKKFMNQRFKLSCYMCGNSSLGLMSLAADNQRMIRYTLYGYLLSNIIKRFLKEKIVDVTFEEAYEMAKQYNDSLLGNSKIAI